MSQRLLRRLTAEPVLGSIPLRLTPNGTIRKGAWLWVSRSLPVHLSSTQVLAGRCIPHLYVARAIVMRSHDFASYACCGSARCSDRWSIYRLVLQLLLTFMDAFALVPPEWTKSAVHAVDFCCPSCKTEPAKAKNVWLNRRAPVSIDNRRKYQEFYLCECDTSWWGWSDDRPPSKLVDE